MLTIFTVIYALLVGILTILDQRLTIWQRAFTKMSAASIFVLLPLLSGTTFSIGQWVIYIGLCLCWFGDLGLVQKGVGWTFKAGLFAFLAGHIAYATGFYVLGIDWTVGFLVVPVIATAAIGIFLWLGPKLPPSLKPAVLSYIVAIAAMTSLAWCLKMPAERWIYGVGATLFLLSDISVALQRFTQADAKHRLWGIPMYFFAQMVFVTGLTGEII